MIQAPFGRAFTVPKKIKSIYIIGSLRNPEIPKFANELQAQGFEAFADWYSPGPQADDFWRDYQGMTASGVRFVSDPREESYGTVAVFEDLYGNKWDLLQLKS